MLIGFSQRHINLKTPLLSLIKSRKGPIAQLVRVADS